MDKQQGNLCSLSNCAVEGRISKKIKCFQISVNGKVGELWQREWVAASEVGRGQVDDGGGNPARRRFIASATKDLRARQTRQEKTGEEPVGQKAASKKVLTEILFTSGERRPISVHGKVTELEKTRDGFGKFDKKKERESYEQYAVIIVILAKARLMRVHPCFKASVCNKTAR